MAPPSPGPEVDPAAGLLFIINAAAGHHERAHTRAAIEAALAAAGRSGELLFTPPADLAHVAMRAAAEALARHGAVVAVGGDGTINAVAQAAYAAGCTMGVVPQGTFNYFARAHGIPTDTAAATRALLGALPLPVQVGLINDRVFLVNASLGLYPELLQDREAWKARFGRSRLVAFGAAVVTLLSPHGQLRLRITTRAGTRDVTTPTLFIANNRLQLEQVGLPQAPALDEGCLAAVMSRPIGALALLGLLWRGAQGRLGEADAVSSFEFHHLLVRPRLALGRRTIRVAFDGEAGRMPWPLDFRVAPRPLWLLKPRAGNPVGDPEAGAA
jgi:diacylglycerol kinase family enzyme